MSGGSLLAAACLVLFTSGGVVQGGHEGGLDLAELLGTALSSSAANVDWAQLLGGLGGGTTAGGGADWIKLLGAALSGSAHRHSDDPMDEDIASHFRHTAATALVSTWLHSLWTKVPEEWTRPIEDVARMFRGAGSNIEPEVVFRSLENAQLRRQWIRAMSGVTASWIKHFAQPQVIDRYVREAASYFGVTNLVDGEGRIEDRITVLVDSAINKQLGFTVQSAPYVKPAARYILELVKMGGRTVSTMSAKDIDDKVAEGLNNEVIETVLRVWRAHKYSIVHRSCDARLICELNSPTHFASSNSTLKPAVTKLASLVSSWFLSGYTGTPFLELYAAATENYNCREKFPSECGSFHEEDLRITTDYYHSEL